MANFGVLRSGSRSPQVELLQLGLNRAGYKAGDIDGIFGNNTLAALTKFQMDYGIDPNGVVGTRVWRTLMPYLTGYFMHTVRPGDTFGRLSSEYSTTIRSIETANPDADPMNLRIGYRLIIPFGFFVVPSEVSFTSTVLELCVRGLRARYPFLRSRPIGMSVMGKPLYCLTIGEGSNEVFYNATHHANEWITSTLIMTFLERYCIAYSAGGEIFKHDARTLYAASTLFAAPMVDPDGVDLVTGELTSGRYYSEALEISVDYPSIPFPSGWKSNIAGTDLNIQYPAGWDKARDIKFAQGWISPAPRDYVGLTPLSAPESRAVYNFTKTHDFSLTLSYHTQGGVIYWKYQDIAPEGAYKIAQAFAAVSGYAVSDVPYESGYAGYKDWFIDEYDRPGFTVEAGYGQSPLPISQFPEIYRNNEGILTLGLTAAAKG